MRNIWLIALISIVLGTIACSKDKNEKIIYTVTFDSKGGSPTPTAQSVETDGKATAPATNPAKTGYVFLFWHLSNATTAYNFSTPITGNITLYAQWKEEATVEYWQVTWYLNGGTWPAQGDNHTNIVVKGGTLAQPAAPVKAGGTLEGWYKEAAFINKVTFPYDASAATGPFTLYAKWKNENGDIKVTGISLDKTSILLPVGGEETLVATITPAEASETKKTWQSSDSEVATVDDNGKVKGIKKGTAVITVSAGGKSATCNVSITDDQAVGDYYYEDGSFSKELNSGKTCIGIVFRAKTATLSGLIVSYDEVIGSWGSTTRNTNARDRDNGATNLEKIKGWNSWEDHFPAFRVCAAKGEGWYLPAINELIDFVNIVKGNATFNAKLTAIPGVKVMSGNYWSSTESSMTHALVVTPVTGYEIVSMNKSILVSGDIKIRAVKAF